MKFRRRAKIFPGVYLNLSASGISTTIGPRGFNVNMGKDGTYLNTGIPGTGLYDRTRLGGHSDNRKPTSPNWGEPSLTPPLEHIEIKSSDTDVLTTKGLESLKLRLEDCHKEKIDLLKEVEKSESALAWANLLHALSYLIVLGFFIKWFKQNREEKVESLKDLRDQLNNCFIEIDIDLDPLYERKFSELDQKFKEVANCERIWDITSEGRVDRYRTRSSASTEVTRTKVNFNYNNIDIIKSRFSPLHLENANGGNIYIYPSFIVVLGKATNLGLIDIRDTNISFNAQRFVESDSLTSDAEVIDKTWAKVNKNGSPDKRFKDNYQIPVCKYGELSLTSPTGLYETYSFSSYVKSEPFGKTFLEYQVLLINKT